MKSPGEPRFDRSNCHRSTGLSRAATTPGADRVSPKKVFREVGRSVWTVALLRYLADPQLRARVTAATNKVESYNGLSAWLGFGNNGVLAGNRLRRERSAKGTFPNPASRRRETRCGSVERSIHWSAPYGGASPRGVHPGRSDNVGSRRFIGLASQDSGRAVLGLLKEAPPIVSRFALPTARVTAASSACFPARTS
jgi:hypothetical protein